jgi:hypothetical protein
MRYDVCQRTRYQPILPRSKSKHPTTSSYTDTVVVVSPESSWKWAFIVSTKQTGYGTVNGQKYDVMMLTMTGVLIELTNAHIYEFSYNVKQIA